MSAPAAQQTATAPAPRPQGLLIASTLCWVWGILIGFSGVALVIPAVAGRDMGAGPVFLAVMFLPVAAAYCAAGYLVRKARLVGGWIAACTAGLMSALLFLGGIRGTQSVGLAINLVIIVLVVSNRKHLRASGGA